MLEFDYEKYGGWMRGATKEDLVALAPRLRKADRDECIATTGLPPELVVPKALAEGHEVYVGGIIESPTPELVVGFTPITEGAATIWMVSSDVVFDHRLRFLRVTRDAIEACHDRYHILTNFIDERNTDHLMWLKWLNFKIIRRVTLGPQNLPFLEFVSIREQCAYPSQEP